MKFSKDFIWGAATAAYQVEGAFNEDGRGPSIWDTFSHTEGKVANFENGDVACDHYHRLEEDVKLMKEMGLMAYRFSISWTRLFPKGDEERNEAGFQFYDKLVNLLLENEITPVITIFHWDLPQILQDKGGFAWDGISDAFAFYAKAVVEHFSDRVKMFVPINEPQCIVHLGYAWGLHAPGLQLPEEEVARISVNLMLCHGKAVKVMREVAKQDILIGPATTGTLCSPVRDLAHADGFDSDEMVTKEAIEKSYELSFPYEGEGLAFSHNWFLDPVVLGTIKHPSIKISEEEMEIIHQPIDFLAINVYNGKQCDENGYVERYQGFPRNALGWPITPDVMNYGMRHLYRRYNLPIYISENGQACNDHIFADGKVHDADRIDYTQTYLKGLWEAVQHGADIRGYFHWSLMDNFEWHSGYDPRFGLVFVDFRTNARIWKDSAFWYQNAIKKNKAGEDWL